MDIRRFIYDNMDSTGEIVKRTIKRNMKFSEEYKKVYGIEEISETIEEEIIRDYSNYKSKYKSKYLESEEEDFEDVDELKKDKEKIIINRNVNGTFNGEFEVLNIHFNLKTMNIFYNKIQKFKIDDVLNINDYFLILKIRDLIIEKNIKQLVKVNIPIIEYEMDLLTKSKIYAFDQEGINLNIFGKITKNRQTRITFYSYIIIPFDWFDSSSEIKEFIKII